MKVAAALLALCGSAAAFAPAQQAARVGTSLAALEDMPGGTAPWKNWDPLGLATLGSDSTLAWFRAAELKHSRVAMLATTGYLVQAAGWHFPGMLSSSENISFEQLSQMKPLDAWTAVPDTGKAQIYFTILLAEIITEAKGVHYTKGGDLPTIVFPPINFAPADSAEMKKRQDRELNNGRLAMISIMSFVAAANIPGSVPALTGNPMF
uniref:Plastid light harvesting protein n=1 Tax=Odontella aurita TaxID=265563 RepID=A0A7S4NF69_9STRA|mmetsp:Transcript_60597/g.179636  ORF Transcript_60597/g.179636 Transcript_60597/m.179636 type:complete len:208 (+) Transcript_60597:58-681(+)|eukprot:CAMPEP_0113551030 /NCGR_PEP_ID=MMETSP0015_2-20120614/14303_1 /TAXON_ID=2838 /ORGANISM="Odontella" /LENGTH=207 /DNA_ID=CAMNT_0000451887 /DNA_START=89 /DNA_END=712 /DNA_ORIENTATION=+ /assembly_acc=CAM_ASM_000160